jgi:ammonium transporter, Amt family
MEVLMNKLIKNISALLISLIFLINMGSAGNAETTISAEVGRVRT